MSDAKEVQFTFKVMINKQKTKVLFAEIDSNFADVLLSLLTLRLGTIARVLKKHYGDEAPAIGSLTTLYNGLANLHKDHFWTEGCKEMILNRRSSFEAECRNLKVDVSDAQPTKFFSCENCSCVYPRSSNISIYYDLDICFCGKSLKREVGIEDSQAADGNDGVFTINTVSFLISDDLRMVPNLAEPFMKTLKNLGITDTEGAEMRNVTFGFNEIMDLLKASLLSRTPLSDIILSSKRHMYSAKANPGSGRLFLDMEEEATCSNGNMILNVVVQKSTNKLLFAQSGAEFIDHLCTWLTLPLGRVEWFLTGETSLKNIDNLYKILEKIDGDKYLRTPDTYNRLINPLPPHIEENPPLLYYHRDLNLEKEWLCYTGQGPAIQYENDDLVDYVKGSTMYMVTDDFVYDLNPFYSERAENPFI